LKIVLVSSLYAPFVMGGAEKVVQELAAALLEGGHQVVVVTSQQAEGQAAATSAVVDGVRVHYLPVRNIYRPFGTAEIDPVRKAIWHAIDTRNGSMGRAVGAIVESERPDVVNTHNIAGFSTAVWQAARNTGAAVVHTLHDQYLLCPKTTMFRGEKNCATRCLDCSVFSGPRRKATKDVDAVIGVSRFILDRRVQRRGVEGRAA
jgi:glycosyltransferase involved in cell wall biosynthesis